MSNSINNAPAFCRTIPIKKPVTEIVKDGGKARIVPMHDSIMLSSKAQDVSLKHYDKMLKDIDKELKNLKPENFDSKDEYLNTKERLMSKKQELLKEMKDLDLEYTEGNGADRTKLFDSIGKLFKDTCEGVKNLGSDLIKTVVGFFAKPV